MTTQKNFCLILFVFIILLNTIQSQGLCDTKLSFKTKDGQQLNLLDIKTIAHINGTYAEIEYSQIYENHFNETVETEFYFPRNEKSIFHKFIAIYDNTTIVGQIFEKEEAKKLYEENKEKGNTVAYSEINEKVADVMKILVGNIPSKAKVEIKFSIIEPVEIILNKFYSFRLQSTLTPRYSLKDSTDSNLNPDIKCVQSKDSNIKNWHIKLVFVSGESIEYIRNPSHKIEPVVERFNLGGDEMGSYFKYTFESDIQTNKDFEVNWSYPSINSPKNLLVEHPEYKNDYVLLTSFLPELNEMSLLEVEEKFLSGNHLDYLSSMDMEAPVEFIFVIDRSGSMEGNRIENLKKALKSFINILPSKSYFNLVSFGHENEVYSPEGSLKISRENAKQSLLDWINDIEADMGGTEIYRAVNSAVNLKKIDNHSRIVVLLTDGDVYDSSQVINLVKNETDINPTKFCSVGIGNGISYSFIKEFGKFGRCVSVFVKDEEDIGDKTIHIVKSSLSQHLKDIKFNVDCFDNTGRKIFSDKKSKKFVLKNERVEEWFYMDFSKDIKEKLSLSKCTVEVRYKSSFNDAEFFQTFNVENSNNPNCHRDTEVWHKIAYMEKINKLDSDRGSSQDEKEIINKQIVDLSLRYQILTKFTSFFTLIKEAILDKETDCTKSNPRLIKIRNVGTVDWDNDIQDNFSQNSQPHSRPLLRKVGLKASYQKMAYLQAEADSVETENFHPSPPDVESLILIDVIPCDLSVEVDNKLNVISPRGIVIPNVKEKTFRIEDLCKIGSPTCKINFWMGMRKTLTENFKLGEIEIDVASLVDQKIKIIKVIIEIDENSNIEIKVTDDSYSLIIMKKVDSHLKLTKEDLENLNRDDKEDILEKDDL